MGRPEFENADPLFVLGAIDISKNSFIKIANVPQF